jgi:hypothetical protein
LQLQPVVLYQSDPTTARSLASGLAEHFHYVFLTGHYNEVASAVARHRATGLVLDLETSGPGEVERLHSEFPALCIVGTHRLADDKLWAEAMSLGAADICEPRHTDVVRSLLRGLSSHAAA